MYYTEAMKAREFAIHWHGDQMYGDKPYVYHLDQVHAEVVKKGFIDLWGENVVAYLHDVYEDTGCPLLDIEELFGVEVREAVHCISKTGESYGDYIAKVKSNPIALTVKIADTKCNLRQSILDDNKGRIVKYAKQLMLLED